MSTLRNDMTVDEVVRAFPAALAVFGTFGIDACCGGALPFLEAAARHRIDEETLLNALRDVIRAA